MDIAVYLFINLLSFHNIINNDIHLVLLYVSPGHVRNCPLDMFFLYLKSKLLKLFNLCFHIVLKRKYFYLLITYTSKADLSTIWCHPLSSSPQMPPRCTLRDPITSGNFLVYERRMVGDHRNFIFTLKDIFSDNV